MPPQVKKVLFWIFWIFIAYAVLTSPGRAADMLAMAWSIIVNGFHNIGVFFDRLLGR